MSDIQVHPGTDDLFELVAFVGNSLWLIFDRFSGALLKLVIVIGLIIIWRVYVLLQRNVVDKSRPKSKKSPSRGRDAHDSDDDDYGRPREISSRSRGRSPRRTQDPDGY